MNPTAPLRNKFRVIATTPRPWLISISLDNESAVRLRSPVLRLFIAASLCFSGAAVAGQAADGEKIRDISPDGQFALRISYDEQLNKEMIERTKAYAERIFPDAIKGVDLVAIPSKKSVTNLFDSENSMGDITLLWSADSKWFAFYHCSPRVGDTAIYHRSGDEFAPAGDTDTDHLRVSATKKFEHGDLHSEYVHPIRWTKPGVLVLEQISHYREQGDETFQFTVGIDPKSGKFRILSKKKVDSQKTGDN
jgi:DUF971 family protein